jgi:hypothetical protein
MNGKAYSNLLKLIIFVVLIVLLIHRPMRMIPYQVQGITNTSTNGIFDLGHEVVDRIYRIPQRQCDNKQPYEIISNSVMVIFALFGLIPLGIDIVLRYLGVIITVHILKRIYCYSTILPNPRRNKCWPNHDGHSPLMGVCNELFFSGHFIGFTLMGFIIWTYLWSPLYFGAYSLFYLFAIYWNLSCQYHYSIDILTSIPVTLLVAILVFRGH